MITFFAVPGTGFALQKSAVACETRSTLAKVKSSAITALQPSVPNLICAINNKVEANRRESSGVSPLIVVFSRRNVVHGSILKECQARSAAVPSRTSEHRHALLRFSALRPLHPLRLGTAALR